MTTINPYLTFNGTCEKAFNFYANVFHKELSYIGRFSEMPSSSEFPVPEEDKELVMHVSLPISKETVLMGSDTSTAFGKLSVPGSNFTISINTDSLTEADRIFEALAQNGKITMPISKTFWKAYFGMLTDQFGIHWMVNYELPEHKDFEEKNKNNGK